ncbi:MAG: RDD family protein [Solirubrobacteraceae bacterium]
MSNPSESPAWDTAVQTALEKDLPYVGLVTRGISWVVDALLINLVAIITGLGVELIASIFPITRNLKPFFLAIAAGVYLLWTAAYFVVFWSISGQTPGSRLMQVRLVTPGGGKVKPARALVRWIGMNVAMVPLPWGYVPIPFERLGFPDWLAHTRVIEAPELSIAEARRQRMRDTRASSRLPFPPVDEEIIDDR